MIKSRLTLLALAGLLSSEAFAGASGPTDPVERPKSPATQGSPSININPPQVDESTLPPATGTDPRIQGNDTGRAGTLDTDPPDSKPKTTTGGTGSEGHGTDQ
ncbi:hypothetical protein C4K10_1842 [Pseudomonas chlororaphis subsp. aureofaciens]|uniref:Uncharacterized protein n=1 Tax=Pseudomonas chlororaphis O6 TaxID=1037915 RepID=A0AB33WKV0_9PSED|nr:hypothetical protein [Pseudomonas chlororaphis]AZE10133.1 hypothetical protein C4K10_1842 [Pseudomonas chlororaphis subsp. aureofaciens]EIM13693.1 hypothetical protein PchlO6_1919 [Pseudomonas chlororaphis O6]